MRTLMMTAAVTVLAAAPLLAQEQGAGGRDATGYVTGLGGFAASVGNTTGDMLVEGGVRIAPLGIECRGIRAPGALGCSATRSRRRETCSVRCADDRDRGELI